MEAQYHGDVTLCESISATACETSWILGSGATDIGYWSTEAVTDRKIGQSNVGSDGKGG